MNINRNNYEAFFLDYLEGRLDEQYKPDLMEFVAANPDLCAELEEMELLSVAAPHVPYSEKAALKKSGIVASGNITVDNYEDYFVAWHEFDLSEEEKFHVIRFLQINPVLQSEFDVIGRCRLWPDRNIIFPGKQALKKPLIIPMRRVYYAAVAAAWVIVLLGLVFLINRPPSPATQVVENKPSVELNGSDLLPAPPPPPNLREDETKRPRATQSSKIRPDNAMATLKEDSRLLAVFESRMSSIPVPPAIEIPSNRLVEGITLRNEITPYFGDIILAQMLRYDEPASDEPVMGNLLTQGPSLIRKLTIPESAMASDPNTPLDWWEIANLGVHTFSRITNSSLRFTPQRDDRGNVTAYALQSESLNINRNVRKPSN